MRVNAMQKNQFFYKMNTENTQKLDTENTEKLDTKVLKKDDDCIYDCLVEGCDNKTKYKRYKFCDQHYDHAIAVGNQPITYGKFNHTGMTLKKAVNARTEEYWLFCMDKSRYLQVSETYPVNALRRAFVFNEIIHHTT